MVFVATAEPFDGEMERRIQRHQMERGSEFVTLEEPYDLARALGCVELETRVVVVDCLTVWLGNLMHRHGEKTNEYPEVKAFLEGLGKFPYELIVVSNELGMGVVPDNEMSRRFRDIAGMVNQRVARAADEMVLMVSGIPLSVKKAQA